MSITYEEALDTLNSMFTSPWTTESLDSVLRHFEGHMENTIEAILAHGDGEPEDLIRSLASGAGGGGGVGAGGGGGGAGGVDAQRNISMDEEIARQLAAEEERGGGRKGRGGGGGTNNRSCPPAGGGAGATGGPRTASSGAAGRTQRGRGTPTELPPDFLRIPGYNHSASSSSAGFHSDEQLARMLQDEMLQQELKNNSEFAHLARSQRQLSGYPRGGGFGSRQPSVGGGGGGVGAAEGPNVMDKLAEMGEQTKNRLALWASQFNAQRQNPGGAHPTQRNAAAQERRGLLDDDDGNPNEEEVSFLGSGHGGGGGGGGGGATNRRTDVEMRNMSSPAGGFGGGGGGGSKKDK